MKLDKLDFAVIFIVAICLAGVGDCRLCERSGAAAGARRLSLSGDGGAAKCLDGANQRPEGAATGDLQRIRRLRLRLQPGRALGLAFAERSGTGAVTLRLRDLATEGRARDLVDCPALAANCTSPVYSPDGKTLAYQRAESVGAGLRSLPDMAGRYDKRRL